MSNTRTTISLLQATDKLISTKLISTGKVKSRNQFIAEAIVFRLAMMEKAEIDAEFALANKNIDN